MDLINALVLGAVEGITEFLPISSTAHLIISSKLLNLPQTEFQKFFEVFIQSGAILAVVVMYFKFAVGNLELMKKVIASFIPTAIIGLTLHKIIKNVFFESYALIIGSLFFVGLVFMIVEYLIAKKKIKIGKSMKTMPYSDALLVGLGQALAVVPGVSRAGIVILTMMVRGYKREEAAVYSFLLAVPTILAAAGLDLLKADLNWFTEGNNLFFLAVGFATSFATAYISVNWLIDYLKRQTLSGFGLYRMLLSTVLWIIR